MEGYNRFLADSGHGTNSHGTHGTTTKTTGLSYDLGVISIFLMLVFYTISNGIIAKYHVSLRLFKYF